MKGARVPNPGATLALTAFLVVANVGNGLYAAHGLQPSEAFRWICYVAVALLVAYWVMADSRRLGVPGSIDQGWFLFAIWPLALPYYLFRTRKWRGFVGLAGFFALFAVTYALGVLVASFSRAPRT